MIPSSSLRLPALFAALMFALLGPTTILADFIYVTDGSNVLKAAPDGTTTTFASGFTGADALAFDSTSNLSVGSNNGNVYKVTPDGSISTFATGLNFPFALTCDSAGNLYVGSYSGNVVYKVTPGGSASTFATGFGGLIQGLAFDSTGNHFVSVVAYANESPPIVNGTVPNGVYKVKPDGTMSTFLSLTANDDPQGLVFDKNGNLYIANFGFSQEAGAVSKVTPGGSVSTFATPPSYPGANGLHGLAIDSNGMLYVVNDAATGSPPGSPGPAIQAISPGGTVSPFLTGPYTAVATTESIPEPSTLVLLAAAGAAHAAAYAWRCRRRRASAMEPRI